MDGRFFTSARDMGEARGDSRTGDWARHAADAAPGGLGATPFSESADADPDPSGFALPTALSEVVDIAYAPWFQYPQMGEHPALLVLSHSSAGPRIDFVEPESSSISHVAQLDGLANVCCLAWDGWGVRLAAAVAGGDAIVRVDPYLGTTFSRVAAPAGGATGLAYDGRHLLYATPQTVHALDPDSGASSWTVPAPSRDCLGLASGDGLVYFGSGSDVMMIDASKTSDWVTLDAAAGPGRISGIAHDPRARNLYVTREKTMRVSVIPVPA